MEKKRLTNKQLVFSTRPQLTPEQYAAKTGQPVDKVKDDIRALKLHAITFNNKTLVVE